jgi:hypothetical protein
MMTRYGSQTALEVDRLVDPRVVLIRRWCTVSDLYGGSNSVSVVYHSNELSYKWGDAEELAER